MEPQKKKYKHIPAPKFYHIGSRLELLLRPSQKVSLPSNNDDIKSDLHKILKSDDDSYCCFNNPEDEEKVAAQVRELSVWIKKVDQEYERRIKQLCETILIKSTIVSNTPEDEDDGHDSGNGD